MNVDFTFINAKNCGVYTRVWSIQMENVTFGCCKFSLLKKFQLPFPHIWFSDGHRQRRIIIQRDIIDNYMEWTDNMEVKEINLIKYLKD